MHEIGLGGGALTLRLAIGVPLPRELPSETVVAARVASDPIVTVVDHFGLPSEVVARLSEDERQFVRLLRENQTVRLTDLVKRFGKTPVRVSGMARTLRRVLHDAGIAIFRDEKLPNGEIMFHHDPTGDHRR